MIIIYLITGLIVLPYIIRKKRNENRFLYGREGEKIGLIYIILAFMIWPIILISYIEI